MRIRIESRTTHSSRDAHGPLFVGKAITTETSGNVVLLPKYGNRHGLVAGATGTGKTVTLMTLAKGSAGSACRCSWPT